MKRKRTKPRLIDIAASFAAEKLPQEERDRLRTAQVPAIEIVRMFTADHIKLHTWGGADNWWNLDMRRRGPELKAKDNADTGRAAKAVRIDRINADRQRVLLAKTTGERPPEPERRRSRKIPSRPFSKQHRPMRRQR